MIKVTSTVTMMVVQVKNKLGTFCSLFVFILGISFPSFLSIPSKSRESGGVIVSEKLKSERECLIEALWHEAAGEPLEGKKAVLSVIKNRKKSKVYPDTYCKVIEQPKQFSYRNNLQAGERKPIRLRNALDKQAYAEVQYLVDKALKGAFKPILEPSVLWYAHNNVRNHWTKKYKKVIVLHRHSFYKEI